MLHELHAFVVTIVVTAGTIGPPAPPPVPAPPPPLNPISEALCGRKTSPEFARAQTLDALDLAKVPDVWRRTTIEELGTWAKTPLCSAASEEEMTRFEHRRDILDELRSRLARLNMVEQLGGALLGGDWPTADDLWPKSSSCEPCAALRLAAKAAASAASKWPKRRDGDHRIGTWLDLATPRELLVADLCAARPALDAEQELAKRFKYYTWTAGGMKLIAVARWFDQPEVTAVCPPRP